MNSSEDTPTPGENAVTELLIRLGQGNRSALDELFPLVYRELHRIAKRSMAHQNADQTLQTTAMIHEAYLKLAGGSSPSWKNRAHFFGVAAKAMRHVLVDHARRRGAEKRGGQNQVLQLDENLAIADGPAREIIQLDDALRVLAASYPRQAEVVELRYFAGLSVEEAARTLDVSPETVARDWRFAKSFLRREMLREAQ